MLTTPSYRRVINYHDESDIEALLVQSTGYLEYLRQLITLMSVRRQKTGALRPDAVAHACRIGWGRYRIRYQALEAVAASMRTGSIAIERGLMLSDASLRALRHLLGPDSTAGAESLQRARHWFERHTPNLSQSIVVVHTNEEPALRPDDHLGWTLLTRTAPTIICEWHLVANAAHSSASALAVS